MHFSYPRKSVCLLTFTTHALLPQCKLSRCSCMDLLYSWNFFCFVHTSQKFRGTLIPQHYLKRTSELLFLWQRSLNQNLLCSNKKRWLLSRIYLMTTLSPAKLNKRLNSTYFENSIISWLYLTWWEICDNFNRARIFF